MSRSNFDFLHKDWSILAKLGATAEKNVYADPNTTLIKLRMFAETITKYIFALEEIDEPFDTKQIDRLRTLTNEGLVNNELHEILNTIRRKGNKAVHEAGYGTVDDAKALLHMAFQLSVWFMQVYGEWDFKAQAYIEPEKEISTQTELKALAKDQEKEIEHLQEELDELRAQQLYIPEKNKSARKENARFYGSQVELNEAQTRMIIDQKLRDAGWEADTKHIRYSEGSRPEKNRNMAIAEWPFRSGRADYALFVGLEFIGIVEAKRASKNIPSDIEQAKNYAKEVVQHENEVVTGFWGDYKIPFLFATNGREYIPQLEEKSGIWFLDVRKSTNHPRALRGWYSPQGLKDLLKQDTEQAVQSLEDETMEYLGLRNYQNNAILAVERALKNNQHQILIAMATGTGKTRMAIGLIYRLIKSNRFKRILFLVDRSALGEQAEAAFKDSKLENYLSFTEIFELQTLEDKNPNPETKVQIATVQGMVKRLFYNESNEAPTVDQYDCIVVDEAHRGYTLDKEMSEVEILFRDHNDYVSKYRKVLDYFDAVRIGLTATPAVHTTEIFGKPIFNYSYREAVIDGYLIDHEPPYQFETALKKRGINWRAGEEVAIYDNKTGSIEKEKLQDEVNIEVTQFNKMVITENFNKVILKELANYIYPDQSGKTLIFAASDEHADMVVRLLKKELEEKYGEIEDNLVMKITGSIKDPLGAIKYFKNERLPQIVVTVDLLTTGIDVPAISNLVFLRRVRSRILYEQMLGRATRRCDEIGKDHFEIFDAVGIYESLKPYSDMQPVVTRPSVTLNQLFYEYEQLDKAEHQEQHKAEMIAKIQRKKQKWTDEEHEGFKALSGGKTIDEFIDEIKEADHDKVKNTFKNNDPFISFIDENRVRTARQYISDHEDELIEVTRGYGNAEKPEDYLESFNQFIEENLNEIPALHIICTRPKDLTREDLRQLRIALDQQGYNEKNLQAAWRDARNQDIAADIIGFIRKLAIGDPLISHEERIRNAMKQIYEMKVWPKRQKEWLERIEKQLLKESILDPEPEKAFNVEPFKSRGGYNYLNKRIFQGELDDIVEKINEALYSEKEQA